MTVPDQDQLLAYVYEETDAAETKAIEQHLRVCEEDRAQVKEWRSTMSLLDTWILEEAPADPVSVFPGMVKVAKMVALLAVLIGMGVMLGLQWQQPSATIVTSDLAVQDMVAAQVQSQVTEQRLKLIAQQQQIEEQLLMASASQTHQKIQGYVRQALDHLDHHEMRNEMLAMLLPAEEQAAYEAKRDGLQTVATAVERETARQQQYMQQIIARARERAISKAH
jgi:hypothetical protein